MDSEKLATAKALFEAWWTSNLDSSAVEMGVFDLDGDLYRHTETRVTFAAFVAGMVAAAPLAPSDTQGAEVGQIEITEEDAAMLNSMLDAPPQPNAALTSAFAVARQAPDAVRDAAYERAATECEAMVRQHNMHSNFVCAKAIRALKSTAPKLAEAGKGE